MLVEHEKNLITGALKNTWIFIIRKLNSGRLNSSFYVEWDLCKFASRIPTLNQKISHDIWCKFCSRFRYYFKTHVENLQKDYSARIRSTKYIKMYLWVVQQERHKKGSKIPGDKLTVWKNHWCSHRQLKGWWYWLTNQKATWVITSTIKISM